MQYQNSKKNFAEHLSPRITDTNNQNLQNIVRLQWNPSCRVNLIAFLPVEEVMETVSVTWIARCLQDIMKIDIFR